MDKRSAGFSLMELMIVVGIIAIISAISYPSYQNYIKKAKVKEAQSNLVALSLSAESNYQRLLSYPTGELNGTALTDKFTTWSPSSDSFSYKYEATDSNQGYKLTASGASPLSDCTLSLTHKNIKTISGCGSINQWVK